LLLPASVWAAHAVERDVSRAFVAGAVMGCIITPLPTTTLSDTAILVDAQQVAGVSAQIELSSSSEASVQMSDTPTDGAAAHVSLFQSNMVALRATRFLAAALLRSDAAVIIESVSA
jgi:hypothetical protein